MTTLLKFKPGKDICEKTGYLINATLNKAVTQSFYKALPKSKLSLKNFEYTCSIVKYSMSFDDKYIYTYDYAPDESWTSYVGNLEFVPHKDYIFEDECYFRVILERIDGKDITDREAKELGGVVHFDTDVQRYQPKQYFEQEINITADTVRLLARDRSKTLVFGLITDSHYVVNGTWEDTAYNIKAVAAKTGFDAIVHLGDLTDGMVPGDVTKDYVLQAINDLKAVGVPLYMVLGNHDTNYFNKNPESFTPKEQYNLYLGQIGKNAVPAPYKLYYYVDIEDYALRCLFLHSFDQNETMRYGYSDDELDWLERTLDKTPCGCKIVIFSHLPPLGRLHYWSKDIRNSDRLMAILNKNSGRILAYINGHNHADHVDKKEAFPIVSIGCSKLEYFTDKKPDGMYTPERKINTVTQDLWDVLLITPTENRVDFVRFGAGEDRYLKD